MNNDTTRDVFEKMKWELISNLANTIDQNGGLRPLEDATKVGENYATRYAAALPDNLPVIPKAVGEYIRKAKEPGKLRLLDVFWRLGDNISAVGVNRLYDWQRWMYHNQVAVALAWVLGAWRVEETGEIVKLEE